MVGLTGGSTQYNGRWGTVLQFLDEEDKYIVQLGPEKAIKMQMDKCRCAGGGGTSA